MEQAELEDLYRRNGHLVLRRCQALLRDEAEAQDMLQDVFIRAMKYERSLSRAESQLGWLYRTSERCCFDRLKKRGREVSLSPELMTRTAAHGFPEAAVEARDVVLAFLGRFDKKVQQVAVLHYLDGLPQEEIARRLGWSRRTVGKKLDMLRQRAKKLAAAIAANGEN